ncbi:MAG: restriction endonuclease subunit S [Pseudomonadota bacterium]|nr:restriction endonuclease subunit S [Pseudomonadota bacterium]
MLTASGDRGLIDQEEFFNKSVAGADLSNYLHIKRGEFAYNRSAMKGYPVGAVKRLDRYPEGVVSSLYLCFGIRGTGPVHGDFAAHVFGSSILEEELRPIVKVGARAHGLLNVSADDFMSIRFPVPPLPEQKKIAAILSSVDESIQATRAVIDQTRRVKEGLLQDLLTRGIGHTRFKQTEIGEIPAAWEVVTVGSVTRDSAFGPRFSSDEYDPAGNYATMRTTDIDRDWAINYDTMPRASLPSDEFDKHVLQDQDLLVTRSGTCGVTVVYEHTKAALPVIPGAFLIRFRLDRRQVLPQFLLATFQGRGVQEALSLLTAGGVQKNLSGTNIRTVLVPRPPLTEQAMIVRHLSEIASIREQQVAALATLRDTKAGLLADLLTGRVRVTP